MLTASTKTTRWIAPAKVNLCLRIVGRRSDGYHLLDSIFAAIDLVDHLTISISPRRGQAGSSVTVSCPYPGVPNDGANLAARAAEALLAEGKIAADVSIAIDKQIPPGAGLGGGSSNAATVLAALNAMLDLRVPRDRLGAMALALGADVPFFLTGGCARVRGIGEQIEPIRGWPGLELILALPPVAVSTAWAFGAYPGGFAERADEPERLAAGHVLAASLLRNDLESTVLDGYPEIAIVKATLLEVGAEAAVMSGSGAAIVALARSPGATAAVCAALRTCLPAVRSHRVRILGPGGPSIG